MILSQRVVIYCYMMFHKIASTTSLFRQLTTTEQILYEKQYYRFLLIKIPGEFRFYPKVSVSCASSGQKFLLSC